MVFKNLCLLVIWTKVTSALKGLNCFLSNAESSSLIFINYYINGLYLFLGYNMFYDEIIPMMIQILLLQVDLVVVVMMMMMLLLMMVMNFFFIWPILILRSD